MAQHTFSPTNAFSMSSGLASRRGGSGLKPLNELALKSPSQDTKENTVPTPRTSRGHLLANLRTAPKTAVASSFATADNDHNAGNRFSLYAAQEAAMNNGPKTSLPANNYGVQAQQPQGAANWTAYRQQQQHFTPEQILAPPEIHIDDEQGLDPSMDPDLYARLMQQNMQLAQQRFMLQQQLHSLTQAQQQLDAMNLNGNQAYANMYQQQLMQQQQAILAAAQAAQQPQVYAYVDPATGQQGYYIDQSGQLGAQLQEQTQLNSVYQVPQSSSPAPRFEVSPPRETREATPVFRRSSPLRRNESPIVDDPAPLPPPSANAFRRGHKKSASLMLKELNNPSATEAKSAGPRTANFPVTPLTGGYGPGQARAGEHPIRQPRGPPSIEELRAKPCSKMEGSKNFAARTRRSAVNNLKRAGVERRKGTGSTGSISPISETAEEAQGPLSDNESDSGRSGSGSLNGEDVEPSIPSSRTSTGSWGAIGSDRPSSAQKARKGADSVSSGSGDEAASSGSFASVFKRTGRTSGRTSPETPGRKAPMMVFSNAEKRKNGFFA